MNDTIDKLIDLKNKINDTTSFFKKLQLEFQYKYQLKEASKKIFLYNFESK